MTLVSKRLVEPCGGLELVTGHGARKARWRRPRRSVQMSSAARSGCLRCRRTDQRDVGTEVSR